MKQEKEKTRDVLRRKVLYTTGIFMDVSFVRDYIVFDYDVCVHFEDIR